MGRLGIGVGVLAATLSFASAVEGAPVRVVARTPQNLIQVTAAGSRIAWTQLGRRCGGFRVFELGLLTRREVRLTDCLPEFPEQLLLAGDRAMWSVGVEGSHETTAEVNTKAPGTFRWRVASFDALGCGSDGCDQGVTGLKTLGAMTAGGGQLFYGVVDIAAGTMCRPVTGSRSTVMATCGTQQFSARH